MARQYGIKLSISAVDLLKSIKQTINDINNGDKLKNKPLNISVSAAKLRESIRAAIDQINSDNGLKSKPINISASESFLRKSIRTAIDKINASNALANKPIKLNAKFDTKSLAQQIQAQIANATAKASTLNIGTNTNAATLKESVNAVTNAVNIENSAIETTNNLLKEQQKLFLKTGDVRLTQTYGTSGQTVANTYLNGNQVTQTITNDFSRQQKEADKAYAAYSRLDSIVNKLQADFSDSNAIKPIKEQAHIDEINVALTETRNKIKLVETASAESFSRVKADAESAVESLKLFIKTRQNEEYAASQLRAKDIPTVKAIQTNYFDELTAKINSSRVPLSELTNDLNVLQMLLNNITDRNSLTAYLNQLSITEAKFDSLKAKAKETSDFSKQISADLKKLNSLTNGTIFKRSEDNADVVRLREQINSLIERYKTLRSVSSQNSTPEQMAANIEMLRELQAELRVLTQSTASVRDNLRNTKIDDSLIVKINQLNAKISEFVRNNGKAMKMTNPLTGNTYGVDINNIQSSLIQRTQTIEAFDKLNGQFQILRSNIKSVGAEGNTMLTELGSKLSKFAKWFGVTYLFTKARMYFNKLFTTVYELDTALIDLKKTFQGTDSELNEFYYDANKLAKQLGVTTQEIIQQGAAWSRLSYSSKDAMETMAKMSSMFAAISPDMDVSAATDGLISIMKAFDIDPNNVLDGILSKINIVGNTAATSNGEIVEMLKRSSAAMREANNTFEQSVALATAAVEISRDPASTGVAWKTISARLRGLDEETLQVSDDVVELTGKFADFTKTAKTPGGISLFTDESKTTYKSTYQIIKELSEIWDDLTDVQTARIEEVMGGKRQLQIVAATIENFEAAEKAMENMANSAGNAEAEMDVIRESAAYAMNELKETFTSLAQNSVTRDFLKGLIKTGTSLISVVDTLVSSFGALPTVLGVIIGQIATMNSLKKKGLFNFDVNGNLTFQGAKSPKEWLNNLKTDFTGMFTGRTVAYQNNLNLINQINNALATNADTNELCAKAENSNSAAVQELGRKLKDGTATTSSCAAATKQLGAEMKNASIGMKALNAAVALGKTALAMFATTLISMLISKVIKAIDDSVHAVENLNKELNDLSKTKLNLTKEIEDLNDQLKDTKDKIAELEKLPKLTLLQKDELDALKTYNDELERQRKQREKEARQNEIQAHEDAKKLMQSVFLQGGATSARSAFIGLRSPSLYNISAEKVQDETQAIETNYKKYQKQIENYKKLKEELTKLENSDDRDESAIGKKINEIESLEDDILDLETSWQNIVDNLIPSDSRSERVMEVAKDLLKQWNEIYGNAPKNFLELYNSAKFSAVHDALQQLARDGELTAKKFAELNDTDIDGIEDFKKALEEIGETDAAQIVESIIVEVNNLDDAANKGKNSINAYTKSLEKLYETLDKIVDKQEKLAEAFNKVRLGSSLTAEEVYELSKEMPNIFKYLQPTSDGGYTLSTDGFNALSNENIDAEKEKLQKSISEAKTQIALLGAYQKAGIDLENSYGKDQSIVDRFFQLSEATEEIRENLGIESFGQINKGIEKLQETLKQDELHLDVITSAFDKGIVDFYEESKSKISDLNKELQTFDNAIKSLNEGNTLSYDEMVEIVELAPDLQDFFTEMQDGYTISADKIEEWRKKSFEARNEYIQGLIEQAKTELEAAQNAKQAAEIVLNIQNKFGSATEQLMAQVDLEAAEKKIKDILDVIEKYEALMGDLKYSDDSTKKVTDELQNKIDYYKTILDAVSAVKDRYTEAIDNEIDALEESKDALKDANDERQRELDLIEARNNLENAKKRKVYVYTEGEGFKQVQDKAAIKEAEEKYRDAITEIQIAEIDKAIEEREKQKEALEQSVKDLLELEQNIQDSLAISQAMKAYGLTDPSQLLNLSDSIKNDIIGGLADSELKKDIEENKDNTKYIAVTLDNILANLGSNKTMADLSSDVLDNVKQAAYKSVVQEFSDAMQSMANDMINNTTNINNPTINQNNNIVINDATDPQKVGEVVDDKIRDLLIKCNNSLI